MPSAAISVQNLNYYYPGKQALTDVSFAIESGSITALVGPNGAGKTTLLRCLAALDTPFSGEIHVGGIDILESQRLAHTKTGYLSDDFGLYDELTVRQVLDFIAGCHNLANPGRIDTVLHKLRLQSVADQRCGTLSRGWRQRVGIAISIMHQPDVLILDEPASGLDPEARSELSSILRSLQVEGMTILVSSHILAELEEYCTAMLVIRDSRIHEHITLAHHQTTRKVNILITFTSPVTDEQEKFIATLSEDDRPLMMMPDRTIIQLTAPADTAAHRNILKQLIAHDIPVCSFVAQEASLQNLYLEIAKTSEASKG